MDGRLHLQLLGPLQVQWDGAPLSGFESRKALALLCYLAVQNEPSSRGHLAGLFWGDKPEARGRGNLSRVLHNLSTLVPGHLRADRHIVSFHRTPTSQLDTHCFDELTAQGDAFSLAAAVELYRGGFMDGFYLDGCPEFETWLLAEREHWRRRVAQALASLADHHAARNELVQGLDFGTRLLALEPWREETHRQMMRLLARSGQRSAALAQYEDCRRTLAAELDAGPSAETTALYKRIRASGAAPPHNLPSLPGLLVGREDELAALAALLADPGCRLLTLVGPGGIGKTRLAVQAAVDQIGMFLDGVYLVPLAAVCSAEFLLRALADAIEFKACGSTDLKQQLLEHLRDKEILLVLDNFEHLLEAATLLAEILVHAPRVKLLTTSRERLKLRSEWLYDVQGLAFPAPAAATRDRMASYSAVQLFVQRARQVRWGFSLSEADCSSVARICQLVEGLPLAIELTAVWVRKLSCQEIAQELERNLDFLATSLRDVPARHRSLRATFDHTWNLLVEEEATLFMQLSVFRGGFCAAAAEQVAGASPDQLSSLVDKSLLRCNADGRYEIHELLRQYGEQKLQAEPMAAEWVRDLHCEHYAAFLLQQDGLLKGGQQKEALAAIREEIDNVRSAWRWAGLRGRVAATAASLDGLWGFYEIRGRFREGEQSFRRAARSLEATEPDDAAEAQVARQIVIGQVLARQGWFCFRLSQYGRSQVLLRRSVALVRSAGRRARRELAFALYPLGFVGYLTGGYPEAQQCLRESLAISREAGDRIIVADCHRALGFVAQALGEYSEAQQRFQESLSICREFNEQRRTAIDLWSLGWLASVAGEITQAQQLLQKSLGVARDLGDQLGTGIVLDHLGIVAFLLGEYLEARQLHQQSLEILRRTGDQWSIARCLTHLAAVTFAAGDEEPHAAEMLFHQALRGAAEIRAAPVVLEALVGLGTVLSAGDQRREVCGIALLALARQHPASWQETKDRAARVIVEMEKQLPPSTLAAARAGAQEYVGNLDAAVVEILNRQ